MHENQKIECERIKRKFPQYFVDKKVLEIGSLDVNGNNRYLFKDCDHLGIDVAKGKNVDQVAICHKFNPGCQFDVVFSTSSLEHDIHYKKTLEHMLELLKPGGLMFFTVPVIGEHGTLKIKPHCSATSKWNGPWARFYKDFELSDLRELINFDNFYKSELYKKGIDIIFWGIKK